MKDALGHGSNERGGGRKPIPGHPYHAKTNDELRYILKDASEAASASQSMGKLETKYNDQVNDAATVLGYRSRGGKSDAPSDQLASGPKSAPAPIHDSMQSASRAFSAFRAHAVMRTKRLSDAQDSMSRLKETFHAGNGNNRGGEYGRNVREAFDRHAAVVHELTGKRPNIYDR